MPTPSVADGAPAHQDSAPRDTPHGGFNSPDAVAALIDFYTGKTRRRFPDTEFLTVAGSLTPGLDASIDASRTTLQVSNQRAMIAPEREFQVVQSDALTEGPRWYVTYSPGRVRVWTEDPARADRTDNRELDMRSKAADALATWMHEQLDEGREGFEAPETEPSREVTEWSRKSRANMIGSFADLDYRPMFPDLDDPGAPVRLPAMLTLTYPRCWQTVAPNGKAVKAHMKAFRKRYERHFEEPLRCIWKLEFQGRRQYVHKNGEWVDNWCRCEECTEFEDGRAPHVHMLITCPPADVMPLPEFRAWLSRTWADVVAHPNPVEYAAHLSAGTRLDLHEGGRAADPRRVTTYFAKHGGASGKEYQHIVPARWQQPGQGPGRFWGYWGLEKKTVTVQVSPEVGVEAGRLLRRHSRAQQVTREVVTTGYKRGRPDSKYSEIIGLAGAQFVANHTPRRRSYRTRAIRAGNGRGWSIVNDGAMMAVKVARALGRVITDRRQPPSSANASVLERAYALPPSPRRDALIARLESQ